MANLTSNQEIIKLKVLLYHMLVEAAGRRSTLGKNHGDTAELGAVSQYLLTFLNEHSFDITILLLSSLP